MTGKINIEEIVSPLLAALDSVAFVSVTDPKGDITFANEMFVKISGYTQNELIGQNHRILKSDFHDAVFYNELWETITAGSTWRGEIQNKAKDGSLYWIQATITPALDGSGNITNYLAISYPITKLKRSNERIAEQNAKLSKLIADSEHDAEELTKVRTAMLNVLEDLQEEKEAVEGKVQERTQELQKEKGKLLQVTRNMRGGAFLLDEDQRVLFANTRAAEMLGAESEKDHPEKIFTKFKNAFASADIEAALARCAKGESFEIPEVEAAEKVYQVFFHYLKSVAVKSNTHSGYFILFLDRTEEKMLERSKSELVAVASHQLRTPLTAMRGNIEMLTDESFGKLNETQLEILNDVELSTERLIAMVNEMLDITKIEKGDLEMALEKLNIGEILQSILDDLTEYAKSHGVEIEYTKPETDATVYADQIRTRQVFQNLIDNAVKYSRDPARVEVGCQVTEEWVTVSIIDNGIGVPKEEQEYLFDRFYRASNAATSTSSGTGLGLPIAKSVVVMLGGEIWFESEENVGTSFFVKLPRGKNAKRGSFKNVRVRK